MKSIDWTLVELVSLIKTILQIIVELTCMCTCVGVKYVIQKTVIT